MSTVLALDKGRPLSVVTTATTISQMLMVKGQRSKVNGQSALRNVVIIDDRSQCGMDGLVRKNNSLQLVTQALFGRLELSGKH